jgi:serine/threonine protein kinase
VSAPPHSESIPAETTANPGEFPESLGNGRYRIEKLIGTGGTASVFLALDTRIGVHRAIKLLQPRYARSASSRARFRTEAHAQAALQHPHVVMVHDAIEDEQGVYLVMELAEDTLANRVLRSGLLDPREVARVGVAIGSALASAHRTGLVHRDIKPANILIDRHGVYKLADFGIALDQDRGEGLTRAGDVMGTWAFMPPEQREDTHQVDNRSDIYAFGVTLYALLTGQASASLHNREAWHQAFNGVPEPLAAVIQRATRLYPEDRYQTMEEMIVDLQAWLDGAQLPTPPVSSAAASEPAGPSAPLIIGLIVMGLIFVVAGGGSVYWLLTRPMEAEPTTLETSKPASTPQGDLAQPEPIQADPVEVKDTPTEVPAAPTEPAPKPVPSNSAEERPRERRDTTQPQRRVISVIPTETTPTQPASQPAPTASTDSNTGRLVVRTIPSGSSVYLGGRRLSVRQGGEYELPLGTHTIEIRSPSGESHESGVNIRSSQVFRLCYNFDTNSACGETP